MVQQTQLRELIKYIEENMDTAVSSYDAKQIKKILGGILLDEPVRIPEPEQQPEKTRKIEISDYTLVEICRAFRALRKDKNSYIHHVFSDDYVFHAMNEIEKAYENYFGKKTEQITTDQVTEQVQPAKPFDKERFEAMFRVCAIIGNKYGEVPTWNSIFSATEEALNKLDAFYAKKEGGANG